MNEGFFEALSALVSENSVEQETLVEHISAAMLKAAQKAYPKAEDDDFRVEIAPAERRFDIFMKKSVVEGTPKTEYEVSFEEAKLYEPECELGDLIEVKIDPVRFGRSIALFAKQSIRGDLRAINRRQLLDKFEDKEHQLITVKVMQVDPLRGTVTVEYDHTELYLSRNEQMYTEVMQDGRPVKVYETFREGDLIKVYVTTIANRDRRPSVRISRVDRGFVERLLEQAVPEIADGTVVIRGISREVGYRSKVAVESTDPNVDALGSCIGKNIYRINNVIKELNGEKIDVILFDEDPVQYIINALSPATVCSVTIETPAVREEPEVPAEPRSGREQKETPKANVIVPDDMLSLAIGRRGENAKLAAKLTGYKIDIKSEHQLIEDAEDEDDFDDPDDLEDLENPENPDIADAPETVQEAPAEAPADGE